MEKIGFFGGCFNPPTNIHIEIARNLINEKKVNKVIFVPVNDYYEKNNLEYSEHRYNMLKLATDNFENLEVDDIEIKQDKKLYAEDAFELIKKSKFIENNFNTDIFLIMGSDNYKKMPKWKNYKEIKDRYKYIVIERNEKTISSTQIRKMIEEKNEGVKKFLSEEVYKYIIKNNLYSKKCKD